MQVPEVETVFTCTGQGEDITQQQSRFAQLQVKLIEKANRTAAQVAREAQVLARTSRGSPAPGRPLRRGRVSAADPVADLRSDLATLNRLATESTAKLNALGTLEDVTNSGVAGARSRHPDRPPAGGRPGADRRPGGADGAHGLRRLGRHPPSGTNVVGTSTGIDVRVR